MSDESTYAQQSQPTDEPVEQPPEADEPEQTDEGEVKPEDDHIFPDGEYPEEGIFGYGEKTMAEADAEKVEAE